MALLIEKLFLKHIENTNNALKPCMLIWGTPWEKSMCKNSKLLLKVPSNLHTTCNLSINSSLRQQ
jgi:hypothetical protein